MPGPVVLPRRVGAIIRPASRVLLLRAGTAAGRLYGRLGSLVNYQRTSPCVRRWFGSQEANASCAKTVLAYVEKFSIRCYRSAINRAH